MILAEVPGGGFLCREGGLRELKEETTGKQVEKTRGPEMDSRMREGCTGNSEFADSC